MICIEFQIVNEKSRCTVIELKCPLLADYDFYTEESIAKSPRGHSSAYVWSYRAILEKPFRVQFTLLLLTEFAAWGFPNRNPTVLTTTVFEVAEFTAVYRSTTVLWRKSCRKMAEKGTIPPLHFPKSRIAPTSYLFKAVALHVVPLNNIFAFIFWQEQRSHKLWYSHQRLRYLPY